MRRQFERFTISCRDMQASLTFYSDVLGLLAVEEKILGGAAACGLLQLPACRMQIAQLAAADDAPVIIGLFQISKTPMATLHPRIGQPACGQTALVLSTSDFDNLQPHSLLPEADS